MVQVLAKLIANKERTYFPGAAPRKLDMFMQKKDEYIYINLEGNRYICKNWKDAYHKLILAALDYIDSLGTLMIMECL